MTPEAQCHHIGDAATCVSLAALIWLFNSSLAHWTKARLPFLQT